MIAVCGWCNATLYSDKEQKTYPNSLGTRAVYCADSEACRIRVEAARRAKRDLHDDQRLSAGQRTRSSYTI